MFFIFSVAFLLSLLSWRSIGRSNFEWGLQKLSNVDSINDIQILKATVLKIESTVDIHRINAVNKNMSIKSPHEGQAAAE